MAQSETTIEQPKFVVTESPNQMKCVEVRDPHKLVRAFLRATLADSYIRSRAYHVSHAAGAFLQCDSTDYILIEFWREKGVDEFLAYVNDPMEWQKFLAFHEIPDDLSPTNTDQE